MSGIENTANGADALRANTSGNANTANGALALINNTSGNNNIALGSMAGYNITIGSSNIDIGNEGIITDTNIIRIGSGQSQTFIAGVINGNGSGLTNLNVSASQLAGGVNYNLFVGLSGNSATSGYYDTAVGVFALSANTTGGYNTASGFEALQYNSTGGNNTASGYKTLQYNSTGVNNSADGANALVVNTSGSQNTGNGYNALLDNTTGDNNTAAGAYALFINTSGSQNTAAGEGALAGNTSGSNNIALGYQAGIDLTTGSSNIDIGNVGVASDNNIIRIGTSQMATYLVGTVYANGVALTSDRNAKENFQPVNSQAVLAKVASLPVTEWNYKTDEPGVQHIGPMAQDFQAAFQLSADDKHIFVVDEGGVALAAIQGLNQKLEETEQAEKAKDGEIQELKQRLEALEKILLTQKTN
jgi:trimeric autotransporter adhesin